MIVIEIIGAIASAITIFSAGFAVGRYFSTIKKTASPNTTPRS